MHTERTTIDEKIYHRMIIEWERHLWTLDQHRSLMSYYAQYGLDVQFDPHSVSWSIPTTQLSFLLLTL
jgi:hypothetical protein